MPDDDLDEYDDPEPDEEPPKKSRNWRNLEQSRDAEKKRADEAEQKLAEATKASRDLVFFKAGIDPDADPKLRYFMNGYDGEETVEAIKEKAVADGFLSAPEPSPELQAAAAAAGTAAGATVAAPADQVAEAIAEIQNAPSVEEALAIYAKAGGRVKNPLDD